MTIAHITAGAGHMYCGSCLRDNALAARSWLLADLPPGTLGTKLMSMMLKSMLSIGVATDTPGPIAVLVSNATLAPTSWMPLLSTVMYRPSFMPTFVPRPSIPSSAFGPASRVGHGGGPSSLCLPVRARASQRKTRYARQDRASCRSRRRAATESASAPAHRAPAGAKAVCSLDAPPAGCQRLDGSHNH